ncbi:MAG: BON domain-containing protein [Gaiellaceae bacterium]
MKRIAPLAALGGALAGFFFDPVSGRRRRAQLAQRVPAFFRRRGRELGRLGLLNDPALARKVETEIFRGPDVPKGQINVQARDGVVELRGEVPRPELIEELVERARSVPEVREVENLLHVPSTPAPH